MSDHIILWRTTTHMNRHTPLIERVQALEVTEHTVVLPPRPGYSIPRRMHLVSGFERYHRSWSDAHEHVIERCRREVEWARERLAAAEKALGGALMLMPPEEADHE